MAKKRVAVASSRCAYILPYFYNGYNWAIYKLHLQQVYSCSSAQHCSDAARQRSLQVTRLKIQLTHVQRIRTHRLRVSNFAREDECAAGYSQAPQASRETFTIEMSQQAKAWANALKIHYNTECREA
eukprot:1183189-Prorocentrum_minimum.AAC.5